VEYIITVGGFFLIFGAVFMYFGKVYYSSWMYVIADTCWSINSYFRGDIYGFVVVNIGLVLGILTMYKMHLGIFNKSINK
jgi:hypothetical protein